MYDFIVKNLKHGHWIAVKNKDGYWKVFMYLRPDGRFECTVAKETIEKSLDAGFSTVIHSKEEIEQYFTEEYKIVTPAHVLLEPGTKVEILEHVREFAEEIDMVGKKGFEIKGIFNSTYEVYDEEMNSVWSFPHWAVAPIYEPEDKFKKLKVMWDKQFEDIYGDSCIEIKPWLQITTDEQLIAELEKRGRLKDKKVIE